VAIRSSSCQSPECVSLGIFVQTALYINAQYRIAIMPRNFRSNALHSLVRNQQVFTYHAVP